MIYVSRSLSVPVQVPGKTCPQNDQKCVETYSLTRLISHFECLQEHNIFGVIRKRCWVSLVFVDCVNVIQFKTLLCSMWICRDTTGEMCVLQQLSFEMSYVSSQIIVKPNTSGRRTGMYFWLMVIVIINAMLIVRCFRIFSYVLMFVLQLFDVTYFNLWLLVMPDISGGVMSMYFSWSSMQISINAMYIVSCCCHSCSATILVEICTVIFLSLYVFNWFQL